MAEVGQKRRLNVVALISEVTVGKLLICLDGNSLVEDLASKIRDALVKSNIQGRLVRLTNKQGYNLQSDDTVGDVLFDAEEVIAVLTAEPQDPVTRQQLEGGVGELMSFSHAGENRHRDDLMPHSFSGGAEPTQGVTIGQQRPAIPGPAEVLEEDLLDALGDKDAPLRTWVPTNTDWTVEGLTPKLKEYISTRFREVNISAADPGQTFISVSMCPRSRAGRAQPVNYSIARIDVIEFERMCEEKVQEMRSRADHLSRCQKVLQALLDKGASDAEYAPNMLPYRFRTDEKIADLRAEADLPTFGHVEGFRPTILVDTSSGVGESLAFIRHALKRMLYSFIVAKSKFNFLKFSSHGRPVAWANELVPPTAQVLREAEEFLDNLRPVKPGRMVNLLEGISLALSDPEVDSVFILTSGLVGKYNIEAVARAVREHNIRAIPLHIIGIDCSYEAEFELRRIADDNHGSFRHKRFSAQLTGSMNKASLEGGLVDCEGDARLTISAQLSIIQIMIEEQERREVDWLEEQKCSNRLLFSSASQQAVPGVEDAAELYRRSMFLNDQRQLGQSKSGLKEVVETAAGLGNLRATAPPTRVAAAGILGQGAGRRTRSQPRAPTTETLKRPSVVNPWDCSGDIFREAKLSSRKISAGTGTLPRGRSGYSARGRPSSASRVENGRNQY
mmetsp:Transcript_96199/g.152171  ORF Transcript_96199/g.152171 Transcript_96199/m.152171 type:complete len:674 (+) Transcript_96199:27-2048(+)|eukprot:CAMPEP_0169077562 /NCGR_PEP_ID=MMETSP1015-20121227/8945_1 /TAXON_ID=342587 /ORGANISM="Karlodinium micrum, Strain CCMP2283" /LENGTH=673 /DNA_ID=CAMNT_0009137095 /DNA_START=24 /DNA_END=2045 /DNA_ORIENTATION=+